MILRRFLPLALGLGLLAAVAVGGDEVWRPATPGYDWSFPRDDASHPDYKTEWWYLTGHLWPADHDDDAALSFQMTFFRVGLIPPDRPTPAGAWAARDLVMAHASLADPAGPSHRFSEVLRRASPLLGGFGAPGDSALAWCLAPAGTDGRWSVTRRGRGYRIQAADDRQGFGYDLVCTPAKPRVFHGTGGFSPKSADGSAGSLYFSFTRMTVTGTVTRDGRITPVRGQCWLDREIFSNSLAENQTGWDWVSLQLDDGRDLMVYRLRGATSADDFALGTLVGPDGDARSLPAGDWSLEPTDHWTSPATGATYPVAWRLRVPAADLDLELRAVMAAQENVSPGSGVHYWEGAMSARPYDGSGPPIGRGFVELTGYGEGSRPPV